MVSVLIINGVGLLCSLKRSELGKPYPTFDKVLVWWGKIGLNFLIFLYFVRLRALPGKL